MESAIEILIRNTCQLISNVGINLISTVYEVLSIFLLLNAFTNQDPVVQSIVSLTISLRHKFVKQISAKVTNTLLFFVEKM